MTKWILVEERAPEDGQDVLTYWPKKRLIQLQRFYEEFADLGPWWIGGKENHLTVEDGDVTHWMPLPAFPHKESENEHKHEQAN